MLELMRGRLKGRNAYIALAIVLGLVMGWLPVLLHGPIPEKFTAHYMRGEIAVWAYYSARLMIGFWVGVAAWPSSWFVRGPLYGFLSLLPVTFIALSMAGCGWP